ncbi:uncharacterized protein STEHIDRAFT_66971 [Stereum hirsutum FP-91666 SS1]|uniref:uncharacterized protein n=1 Tax=Stereum hirsutum (strain FP-91666) TaxID=721885 RepID=UPI000444949D|nr:uncharacterized protein STEHIDRAFT_66971 [Stereum hirsutum FP-91666 SS1]EIM81248.1 hypothetical protein STEHIDRAFT_66971 [Stereum hirsutum FP-91666 SS1]
MCNLETCAQYCSPTLEICVLTCSNSEGTKYGCGHYVITKKLRKIDCNNSHCSYSRRHPSNCSPCQCEKFLGPDAAETITARTEEYCSECHYWYRGPGAQRRR